MKFNPYLEVIIAAAIFGTAGIFVKIIDLPATTITFFRVAAPTFILFMYFGLKRQNIFKTATKMVIFISLLNALRMYLWLFAYLHTSVGNAVIILYTWPVFTVLLGPLIIKEKLTKQKLALALIAFIGIVIIFSNKEVSFGNKDFIGMLAMLVSASLSAVTTLLFKPQSKHYTKQQLVFFQNVAGAIIFLPFLFINQPYPTLSQASLASIYSALIGLVAFLLWFSALKKIKASTLAIISYTEVVSAIILGALILKEGITPNMVIGGAIILTVSYFARKI
ncbi:MAG TPA: DMT family transporter [Candidatus Limnocylindrales bacterium]|nr:DMT family transporter [Candidatus Limnocylindrales bacterium]